MMSSIHYPHQIVSPLALHRTSLPVFNSNRPGDANWHDQHMRAAPRHETDRRDSDFERSQSSSPELDDEYLLSPVSRENSKSPIFFSSPLHQSLKFESDVDPILPSKVQDCSYIYSESLSSHISGISLDDAFEISSPPPRLETTHRRRPISTRRNSGVSGSPRSFRRPYPAKLTHRRRQSGSFSQSFYEDGFTNLHDYDPRKDLCAFLDMEHRHGMIEEDQSIPTFLESDLEYLSDGFTEALRPPLSSTTSPPKRKPSRASRIRKNSITTQVGPRSPTFVRKIEPKRRNPRRAAGRKTKDLQITIPEPISSPSTPFFTRKEIINTCPTSPSFSPKRAQRPLHVFSCLYCLDPFTNRRLYQMHMRKVHQHKSWSCTICDGKVARSDYHDSHYSSRRHLGAEENMRKNGIDVNNFLMRYGRFTENETPYKLESCSFREGVDADLPKRRGRPPRAQRD